MPAYCAEGCEIDLTTSFILKSNVPIIVHIQILSKVATEYLRCHLIVSIRSDLLLTKVLVFEYFGRTLIV